MNGASHVNCAKVLHPGQSCTEYALVKLLLQTKTALKVATIFVLLPAAIKNIKKMGRDSDCRKAILKKYLRATFYLTIYASLP